MEDYVIRSNSLTNLQRKKDSSKKRTYSENDTELHDDAEFSGSGRIYSDLNSSMHIEKCSNLFVYWPIYKTKYNATIYNVLPDGLVDVLHDVVHWENLYL